MNRAQLLDLAARVEAAKGADRALDADVARSIGWRQVAGSPLDDGMIFGKPPRSPDWLHVPACTASLDAAASLVPDGWSYNVHSLPRSAAAKVGHTARGLAATPALALTAAALRALAEDAE